jgi:hypothetical protein
VNFRIGLGSTPEVQRAPGAAAACGCEAGAVGGNCGGVDHRTAVATIPTAAAVMIAVASQPMIHRPPAIANFPIIALFELMSIIMPMTGTATTPLITALKKAHS